MASFPGAVRNILFINGKMQMPLYAKLPVYTSRANTPFYILRYYLLAKIFATDTTLQGQLEVARDSVLSIIKEAILLHWPLRAIANTCLSICRIHQSRLLDAVRQVGRVLRKAESSQSVLDALGDLLPCTQPSQLMCRSALPAQPKARV